MRSYGYVRNTADQMVSFIDLDTTTNQNRVFYLGDGVIDYDKWVDAFSIGLTGRPARRIPKSALLALGIAGSMARVAGMRLPMDMGRYFRMTTPTDLDLSPTFAAVGHPQVSFEQGVRESLEWLVSTNPSLYSIRTASSVEAP